MEFADEPAMGRGLGHPYPDAQVGPWIAVAHEEPTGNQPASLPPFQERPDGGDEQVLRFAVTGIAFKIQTFASRRKVSGLWGDKVFWKRYRRGWCGGVPRGADHLVGISLAG